VRVAEPGHDGADLGVVGPGGLEAPADAAVGDAVVAPADPVADLVEQRQRLRRRRVRVGGDLDLEPGADLAVGGAVACLVLRLLAMRRGWRLPVAGRDR
jgi:hypothetical protein